MFVLKETKAKLISVFKEITRDWLVSF